MSRAAEETDRSALHQHLRGLVRAGSLALLALVLALASCRQEAGEIGDLGETDATAKGEDGEDSAAADMTDQDTAVTPIVLPERTEMELDIQGAPPIRGRAPVIAECRLSQTPTGESRYEVATTAGEFEGGAAALGVLIASYHGPGPYRDGVTVTIGLGKSRNPLNVLAGRQGCVARVEDPLTGSFSCPRLLAKEGEDSLGVAGQGSWRCWR